MTFRKRYAIYLVLVLVTTALIAYRLKQFGINLNTSIAVNNVTAASCNVAAIQSAVNQAQNGDTISVPAGNCIWTSSLNIDKAIWLRANGTVTIVDRHTEFGPLVSAKESSNGNLRISGFIWNYEPSANQTFGDAVINMYASANGKPILIDGNTFNMGTSGNSITARTNRGLIWNNRFTGVVGSNIYANNASALRHKIADAQYPSWTTPSTWGTLDTKGDQNLYFEDNILVNVLEGVDYDDNARTVTRYNTVINSAFVSHGADTGWIGARHYEIYKNSFVYDTTPIAGPQGNLPVGANGFIGLRGGSAVIWDNIINDIVSQAWGDKSEVAFFAENSRRNAGGFACWTQGYPIPHQVGWGYINGGTQAGSSGVYQDPEQIYIWGNTGGGNYNNPQVLEYQPNECAASAASASLFIQSGRDYVFGPKPNYTPYTYPHPLTLSGTNPAPLVGDLNNDCIVNALDYSIMNARWLTTDATADLNKDQLVNSIDFALMNANWFRGC